MSAFRVCLSMNPSFEPGSHCPNCGKPIRWYDNVPVLSWILLWGKCRDCKLQFPGGMRLWS
ncbi:MAG: prepilin peptidase [Edaphobacter sp.]